MVGFPEGRIPLDPRLFPDIAPDIDPVRTVATARRRLPLIVALAFVAGVVVGAIGVVLVGGAAS